MHDSTNRLMAALRRDLGSYRMILLLPAGGILDKSRAEPKLLKEKERIGKRPPLPLATPNPRLLKELDSRVTKFITENPAIEGIFTREIVRDVDSRTLDLRKLLEKSSLKIRFRVDEEGHIYRRQIEKSSRVPSIDHLALELVRLLEKYSLSAILPRIASVTAAIEIDQAVVVSLEIEPREADKIEEVRRQIQNLFVLLRFAIPQKEAGYFLKDISVATGENRIGVTKTFEKESLASFLIQYYQPNPED
jgi:hypothetical protein